MGKLAAKVALVTGGASGLGRATARRLAAEGAHTVITDVQTELGNSAAAEDGTVFMRHDVSDETQWDSVIGEIEERFAALHILVNNAGVLGAGSSGITNPANTPLADWQRTFAVNVDGVFLGCRAAIPAMTRAGGGSIINISSIAAFRATSYAYAYGASKAAVRQLTKSVAQHCAEQKLGIRCNSIHPGLIRTPLWERAAAEIAKNRKISVEEYVAAAQATVPLGDFTATEDVAAAVAFLASDEARHITGEKLIVDGGIVNCKW
jgi:NAD(P)-dependent dehydrogenase (short-subunit alcohol dehydrogenase family)